MRTEVLKIYPENIDYDLLSKAAEKLKNGQLVVFPTETVYGLGANALIPAAVKNIFTAKGRPSDNPLIVHVSNLDMAEKYIANPEILQSQDIKLLTDAFWPGPLTIIFQKSDKVPDEVTAGLDTVGIRMPENIVARELIRLAGVGVAAPSANISGKPSPTLASHVIDDLYGKVDMIIDSGPCRVGIESTVLDMTLDIPVVLRPGDVTSEQIEKILNKKIYYADTDKLEAEESSEGFIPRAPGMKYKHYAPNCDIIIFQGSIEKVTEIINKKVDEAVKLNLSPGILATDQTLCYYDKSKVISLGNRNDPEAIGASLFKALRQFDKMKADIIFAEAIDGTGVGKAVMDRLNKAAGYRIIKV